MRTVVEELDGEGDVFRPRDQHPIARVTYNIIVWQEWSDTPRGQKIAGYRDTSGTLAIDYHQAAAWLGEPLTLRLADGRWFDFFVTNTQGAITATGPLRDAK